MDRIISVPIPATVQVRLRTITAPGCEPTLHGEVVGIILNGGFIGMGSSAAKYHLGDARCAAAIEQAIEIARNVGRANG